jgi:hypothetical protein
MQFVMHALDGSKFALTVHQEFQREEPAMQTVYPRYTLAERMVLGLITVIIWPVERVVSWIRRKVAADLVPSANRR